MSSLTREQLPMFDADVVIEEKEQPTEPAPRRPSRATPKGPRAAQRAVQFSMLASYADPSILSLVEEPEDEQGWREEYGRPLPRIIGGRCEFEAERIRPDGTMAPCARVSCRLHLLIQVNETTGEMILNEGPMHRLGRPPALLQSDERGGEKEVAFFARAQEQLPKLRFSCPIDARRYFRTLGRDPTEAEVGDVLGVSHETVRIEFGQVQAKWKALATEGGYQDGEHADVRDSVAAMRQAQIAREAKPAPLVQIRRRPR